MKLKQLLKNPKVLVPVIAAIVILAVTGVVLAAHFQASRPEVKESPPTQTTTEKESETETEPETEEETTAPPVYTVEDFLDCLVAKKNFRLFLYPLYDSEVLNSLMSEVDIESYTFKPAISSDGDNYGIWEYGTNADFFEYYVVFLNITKSNVKEFPVGKKVKFLLATHEEPDYFFVTYFHPSAIQELTYDEKDEINANHNQILSFSGGFVAHYQVSYPGIATGEIIVTNNDPSIDPEISYYPYFEAEYMRHNCFNELGDDEGDEEGVITAAEFLAALNKHFRVKNYDITKVPGYRSDGTISSRCGGHGGTSTNSVVQKYEYDKSGTAPRAVNNSVEHPCINS